MENILSGLLLQLEMWEMCARYNNIYEFRVGVADMIGPRIHQYAHSKDVILYISNVLHFYTTKRNFNIQFSINKLIALGSQMRDYEYENILVCLYIICKLNERKFDDQENSTFALKMTLFALRSREGILLNQIPSDYSKVDPCTICLIAIT